MARPPIADGESLPNGARVVAHGALPEIDGFEPGWVVVLDTAPMAAPTPARWCVCYVDAQHHAVHGYVFHPDLAECARLYARRVQGFA